MKSWVLMWLTIKDWCWWKYVIKENEFHPSLDLQLNMNTTKEQRDKECERVCVDRERAHRLDMKWGK